ncbi:hypothetical protein [Terracoccus luteus]|jgi:hypothetical protein|uniref:Zincin peptidase n=1 Tax=Terracoccus luteus TaxID=53356 RepID=A0A495XYN6_9MICO|nr:hypothetical protein [Terracoccus luteus]MBB2987320.1 hypothetical protein [Terracoccus luteus]MCP2172971.1 hypothetical protein [Terracoccus luteus]RKT79721.1 hypothetical protein DFJ68_3199 [Terracoccus luteus]
MAEIRVLPRDGMPWWVVPLAVLRQVRPLLVLLAVLLAAAAAWAVATGDAVPLGVLAQLAGFAVVGVVGSFALHESAHVVALRPGRGITHVGLEQTWLRLSVVPIGRADGRTVVVAALAGPLACVAVGGLGLLVAAALSPVVALPTAWCWAFVAHVVLLLPVFGDGRVLARALLASPAPVGRPT